MNKQTLTELEFLNEKIMEEKQRVYSKGIVVLPAITTITCGVLVSDNFGMAVSSLIMLTGVAATTKMLVQEKKENQEKVKTYKIKNR